MTGVRERTWYILVDLRLIVLSPQQIGGRESNDEHPVESRLSIGDTV